VELITASAIVSFFSKVEEDCAKLYEKLAERFAEAKESFLSFARESEKNKKAIESAYYGVISDKYEACFIEPLNTDNYAIKLEIPEGASYAEALQTLLQTEESLQKFCADAAKSIGSLVPDVSWTFNRISKRRAERVAKLKAMLEKAG